MHCPQCGVRIESEDISYCTRCGQMLERIRLALADETAIARGKSISRSGLNLGVVLMYAGLWPALLAVILSPGALPVAFLMLTAALVAIIFGAGALLRLFQIEELHPEIVRARRKEMAFGSTLMYLAAIMATVIVASGIPDSWVRIMLIGKITAAFLALLFVSKPLYSAYRELASNESAALGAPPSVNALDTASLDTDPLELQLPPASPADAIGPHSVTEGTTRTLESNLTKAK